VAALSLFIVLSCASTRADGTSESTSGIYAAVIAVGLAVGAGIARLAIRVKVVELNQQFASVLQEREAQLRRQEQVIKALHATISAMQLRLDRAEDGRRSRSWSERELRTAVRAEVASVLTKNLGELLVQLQRLRAGVQRNNAAFADGEKKTRESIKRALTRQTDKLERQIMSLQPLRLLKREHA